ncbi:MAG: hypothetical protein NTY30_00800 [Candidatus Berkelbacteria bacterium]|nr:hypothetical protein [Candidatus Berkelbacteria bacterium]
MGSGCCGCDHRDDCGDQKVEKTEGCKCTVCGCDPCKCGEEEAKKVDEKEETEEK